MESDKTKIDELEKSKDSLTHRLDALAVYSGNL